MEGVVGMLWASEAGCYAGCSRSFRCLWRFCQVFYLLFVRALLSNYTRLRNEGLESEALKPKFHRDLNWVAGGFLQAFVGGVIVMDIEVLQGFSRSFLHVLFMSLRVFWGLQVSTLSLGVQRTQLLGTRV